MCHPKTVHLFTNWRQSNLKSAWSQCSETFCFLSIFVCFNYHRNIVQCVFWFVFFNLTLLRVFPTSINWSLSDSKSLQVSGILLITLDDINAIIWVVGTRPLISKSSNPCTNYLVTVLSPPITIGIIVTFIFHSFFSSLARSKVFIYLLAFFQFYPVVSRNGKVYHSAGSLFFFFFFFFFFCWLSLGLVVCRD